MSETAVQTRHAEAARLFQRGVAAARGGQKRVAAGLLSRSVQYDPRNEQAWLWLSGVLDDPQQIAFCLNSALALNPHNERARQGLAWLEQRKLIASTASAHATVATNGNGDATTAASPEASPEGHHEGESWWVSWRHSHRELGRARLLMWLAPLILLALTLGLNLALRDVVARNTERARVAAAPKPTAIPTAAPAAPQATPTPPPILPRAPGESDDAQALAYLSTIAPLREQLRAATDTYRAATSQPGNSAVAHAAGARRLREQIETSYRTLSTLKPPGALQPAHSAYLAGLKHEMAALDDMLEFYGSFSVQLANRATIRMDEASKQFEFARISFAQFEGAALRRSIPAHSAR